MLSIITVTRYLPELLAKAIERIVVEQGQIIKQGKQFFSPTADCTIDELISHQQLIDSNGFTHRQVNSALDLAGNPALKIYLH